MTTLRAVPRTRVDLVAQATCSGTAPVQVRLTDLSAFGAKVVAPEPLGELGQTLELAFDIPRAAQDAMAKIAVAATIRSVKPFAAAGDAPPSYAHGLHFDKLGESDQLLLQNFVLQKLDEAPDAGV